MRNLPDLCMKWKKSKNLLMRGLGSVLTKISIRRSKFIQKPIDDELVSQEKGQRDQVFERIISTIQGKV